MDLRHKERHIKMTSSGTPGRAHPPKADIGNRKINGAQTPLTASSTNGSFLQVVLHKAIAIERRLWAECVAPPWHGSFRAVYVYGGAQRAIWLARGFFTGESRRNPPALL